MRLINNINSQRFSYNGVEYLKNFISKVIGNTITVYNAYDSRDVLFENELYSNIQINGTIYGSAALTQSNLLGVIYTRDSLNGIVQTSGYFNRFTNTSSFSLVGQNLIIVAGWAWEIQGFPYSKEDQTTINIPYATTGKHRIDVVLADTNNNFYLVQGQEVLLANSPAEPAPVPNTLKLTSILVNASGYGTPTDPDNSPIIDNTASHHKNKWNPATNVPVLADGVGNTGDYFVCTADGTQDLGSGPIEFKTDDIIHYNSYDGVWFKFVNNNQVSGSFVPYTGAVADVDLGTNFLLFGANSFMNALEFQISDGTTAVRAEPDYMSVQNSNNEVTAQVTGVKLKNKTGSSNSCTITNSNTTGTGNVVTLNTPDKPTGTYTQATLEDLENYITEGRKKGWFFTGAANFNLFGQAVNLFATGAPTTTAVSLTNEYVKRTGVEYLITTPSTTAIASLREQANSFWLGNTANDGGFTLSCTIGMATGVSTATHRFFVGMTTSTVAPTDVEPSSLTNMLGLGYDSADTNLQMMHNDGSGTATKIDLGSNFVVPTTDRTNIYRIDMQALPNSTTINYKVTNLVNNEIAIGSFNTDIPAVNTLLSFRCYMSVGGTSSVVGLKICNLIINSIK